MFSSFKRLTGTALAVILVTSPAYAAEITPEGAAQLKSLIQSQIDLRKNVQSAAGGQYLTEGELKVEPAGNYYAVTLPHIKMRDASGKTFDVGMVAANVMPGDTDKEWKAAIAIPTPIRIIGADQLPVGTISIGAQRALGVWDMDLSSFTRLDAKYDNVTFQSAESQANFTIGSMTFKNKMDRDANNHLSGPVQAVMSDWTLASPEDGLTGKIADITINGVVKDFDPLVTKAFNDQIGAIGQTGSSIADSSASPQGGLAMYNLVTDMMGKSSDSFSIAVAMNGLTLTGPNELTKAIETFELGSANFGFDMAGFRAGSVKAGFKFGYGGLKLNDPNDSMKDIVPTSANFNLAINNLPYQQMVDLGRTTISTTNGDPQAAQMAGMTAMATMPKLLTDAGTTLEQTFDFAATSFQGKGTGVVKANMNALSGFTADQNVELTGLDALIALIQAEMAKPNNPEAANLQSILGPLTIMQMVGQQKPDAPTTRTYHLVVDEQGKTLLNGSDLSTIMGGAPAQPEGLTAPVPGMDPGAAVPETAQPEAVPSPAQ